MKQKRTIENNKDGEYMDNLENMTEQEFKADLKYRMEQDKLHPHCDCDICKETHKYFESQPDDFLESRWQEELKRRNTPPCSKEEIANTFAKYGLKIMDDGSVVNLKTIERLALLSQEPSIQVPSGLTREERRQWVKDIKSEVFVTIEESRKKRNYDKFKE